MNIINQIKFGFCAPIFSNPGMAFFRTPNYKRLGWDDIKETTLYCEEVGFDSVFIADHLFLGNNGEIFECTTLMSALAALTLKMEIIPIHLCNNFRNPSVVAKIFSTLSHITNGRVSIFYDYGWREAEFKAYDIAFEDEDIRVKKMTEGLEIIKGMLSEEVFSLSGDFYNINKALCTPLPVKRIPIWMGEANNKEMVKSIVKHADVFNSMPCSINDFNQKKNIIHSECYNQDREPSTLKLSLETQILIRETEQEIDKVFNQFKSYERFNNSKDDDILAQLKATNPKMEGYNSKEDYADQFMIGTPKQVKEKLDEYVNLGVEHFMFWFMDYPDKNSIDLCAKHIMPFYK